MTDAKHRSAARAFAEFRIDLPILLCTGIKQILVEADYIANAAENGYSETNVRNFVQKNMKTDSGKSLAKDVFCLNP